MNYIANEGSSLLKRASLCMLGYMVITSLLMTIVFLGIFGMANPDKPAVYGTVTRGSGDERYSALFATKREAIEADAVDIADVHAHFVNWSMWGFVMSLTPLPIAAITAISYCINYNCGKAMGGALTCACGCSFLAWWIAGIIWRFRPDGRYASGDIIVSNEEDGIEASEAEWFAKTVAAQDSIFQYLTGQFMKMFYVSCWVI